MKMMEMGILRYCPIEGGWIIEEIKKNLLTAEIFKLKFIKTPYKLIIIFNLINRKPRLPEAKHSSDLITSHTFTVTPKIKQKKNIVAQALGYISLFHYYIPAFTHSI